MALNDQLILEAQKIRKSFSGVEVLHGVNFSLKKGEIHGLAGANGAGKSTMMKILNGVYRKDSGEIRINGEKVEFQSPIDASESGISMVFQEFSLVPTMTVSQNIFLASEPKGRSGLVKRKEERSRALKILHSLEMDIDPDEVLENLPIGTQQIVEIAKALSRECSILILDEPTASLSRSEITVLFSLLKNLKEKGISIIIITHHLQEIMDICDRVTVLRDGKVELCRRIENIGLKDIIDALVGESVDDDSYVKYSVSPLFDSQSDPLLEVKDLSYEKIFRNISFHLRKGEVLGLAGLLGSGRTELLKNIYGLLRKDGGSILLNGGSVGFRHPAEARKKGISYVPENRHKQGIIKGQSVSDNIMLQVWNDYSDKGLINFQRAKVKTDELIKKLRIKTRLGSQMIEQLSGGNQQKAVIAKAVAGNVDILLLDEPTVGVDISSKQEILSTVRELADEGKAVIMVSSEMNELAQVCDRVLVLREGAVFFEFKQSDGSFPMTEDDLTSASQGVAPAAARS